MPGLCNLCGNDKYIVIEQGNGPFKLVRCISCGLEYLHPLPAGEFIKNYYTAQYYEFREEEEAKTFRIWEERLKFIESGHPRGKLLDIGCGAGRLLALAKEKKWEVYGTEIDSGLCNYLKEKKGLRVYCGRLNDAKFPDKFFDVVSLWYVLEHLDEPLETLKETARVLKDNGILVLAVPNMNSYVYRMLRLFGRLMKRPLILFTAKPGQELHLYYFSLRTINKMLLAAGFEVSLIKPERGSIIFLKRLFEMAAVLFSSLDLGLSLLICARKKLSLSPEG